MKDVKKIPGNLIPQHQIPEDEAHLVHLRLTKRQNDPVGKKYVDRVQTQNFTVADFRQMQRNNFLADYDNVEIIHDPMQRSVAAGDKPLEKMTRAELVVLHKEKFGNEPTDTETKAVILNKLAGEVAQPTPKTLTKAEVGVQAELQGLRAAYREKYQEDADLVATADDLKELLK